ncbi:MAG TPA: amidohydrolase family protein [Terriglobales bacterium]|nr:amidohydrolase family protein [Terriglobales bacterium]
MRAISAVAFVFFISLAAVAQLSPDVREYVKFDNQVVAITHARVIDGTGAAARNDQTILIRKSRIESVGAASIPADAKVIDATGRSVIPGLVDMHGHMFYTAGNVYHNDGSLAMGGITLNEMFYTYPRLYLAGGVTSVRTTGSIEPYTDLNLKKWIDRGMVPGPRMDVTSPYMEGEGTMFPQMHEITSPADAQKTAAYWAYEGVTSFKAYMNITRAELKAVIDEAHKRGLKVTGHLCSVTSREAAELGIDNLEHGPLAVDTEFVANKVPDKCPFFMDMLDAQAHVDVNGPQMQEITRDLIQHRVAVTSTLSVYELDVPSHLPLRKEVTDALLPESLASYIAARNRANGDPRWLMRLQKEMQWERAFYVAGGKLLAGSDPTGVGAILGGDLAGYGLQRELELLVEAGFSPLEAIHITTQVNAEFLGHGDQIGTIAAGKLADLVIIAGDPSANIADIEKVETVFKDGVAYDPAKLSESVRGMVGLR